MDAAGGAGMTARIRLGLMARAVAGVALAVVLVARAQVGPAAATARQAPTPTIDPRLILHPGVKRFVAAFGGGLRVAGALDPSIPGSNAMRLSAPGGRASGRLVVRITMPGMVMVPIAATLTPHGGGFTGRITLPMFGTYRADMTLMSAGRPIHGTATLEIPLPGQP
jgi:hypothetical protein